MVLLTGTAVLYGLRHGIDWDHIAAITDLTSGRERRRGLRIATAYALGHGLVVLLLGLAAVEANQFLPAVVDDVMSRIVGATLVLLAVTVVIGLIRDRRDFRLRSRWMLVGAGAVRVRRWARGRRAQVVEIRHDHPHRHDGHGHGHTHPELGVEQPAELGDPQRRVATTTAIGHSHDHVHRAIAPMDPFSAPGPIGASLIGMLHGIGAETPTQVVVLLTASHVAGKAWALAVLACFVFGILVSNTAIALVSATGYLNAARSFRTYAAVAIVNAVASAVIGVAFIVSGGLPPMLGG